MDWKLPYQYTKAVPLWYQMGILYTNGYTLDIDWETWM